MNVSTAEDTAASALPGIGEVLDDRFEIRASLGEGGMGHVFLVLDRRLDREVALKLIVTRYLGRPEREQRFLRELELGRRVGRHPHLVDMLDGGRLRSGWPFLVMERVEGKALANRLALGPLRVPMAARIARQIAGAIQALHCKGVVHRDITPMNVLTSRSEAVLIDLSHAGDAAAPRLAVGQSGRLTRENEVPGTHQYMPPEQARAEPAQPAMDVYAFGVTLADMLIGLTIDNYSREAFLQWQREGKIKPPRVDIRIHTRVPRVLAELVEACTALDPAQRPAMDEIVVRLDEALATMVVPPEASGPGFAANRPVADETMVVPRERVAELGRMAELRRAEAMAATAISPPPPLDSTDETPVGEVPCVAGAVDEGRLPWGRVVVTALIVVLIVLGAMAWWWSARSIGVGESRSDATAGPEAIPQLGPPLAPEPKTQVMRPLPAVPEHTEDPAAPVEPAVPDVRSSVAVDPPAPVKTKAQPKGKPGRSAEAKTPPPCPDVAADATAASREMRWERVLALTKTSRCWDDGAKRVWLRVEALSELGRYAECVRVGAGSAQPVVKRTVKHCAKQLDKEGTP